MEIKKENDSLRKEAKDDKKNENFKENKTDTEENIKEKKKWEEERIDIEEMFTVETLVNMLRSICIKNTNGVKEKDITEDNCKVMMFDNDHGQLGKKEETKTEREKKKQEDFVNILLYFKNKNYMYYIIFCLKRKNIVYLNYFNPLLSEGEFVEVFHLFSVNDFFPHIILGLSSGRILLYNHEGILCMQNKFIDGKIKKIFIEYKKEYLLFLYENNIIVNSNIKVIKQAAKENSKFFPFDYIFSINKNILINHIILRNGNANDFFLRDMYSVYSKTDLLCFVNNRLNDNTSGYNDNTNYIVTAQNITISIFNVLKTNTQNTFLSKKENFSVIGKVASKINNFIKNIFTKRNENDSSLSINNDSATIDILNSKIINYFNDSKKYITNICVCPWNEQLVLAQDNLGRISLYNVSTLNILHMWKSYRSSFMSFIQKESTSINDNSYFQSMNNVRFDKGVLFYLKRRNVIELWDFKTLSKIYKLKITDNALFLKNFFYDANLENDIYFFNSGEHIFLMNKRYDIFCLKWT